MTKLNIIMAFMDRWVNLHDTCGSFDTKFMVF